MAGFTPGHALHLGHAMSDFILAIDQGTTSSRAIVFGGDQAINSSAQREFPQHYPGLRLGRARPGGHLADDARHGARRA